MSLSRFCAIASAAALALDCEPASEAEQISGLPVSDAGADSSLDAAGDGRIVERDSSQGEGDSSQGDGGETPIASNANFVAWQCDAQTYPVGDACGTSAGVSILGLVSAYCFLDTVSLITAPVIGEDHVYFRAVTRGAGVFASSVTSLRRIPRCGGSTEQSSDANVTLTAGAHGYFSWVAGEKLVTLEESSGTVTVAYVNGTCVRDLALDASAAYYFDECVGAVMRVAHGGNGAESLVTGIPAPQTAGDAVPVGANSDVAVTVDRIFVALGSSVLVAPLIGGAAMPFYESPEPITHLVADVSAIYLTGPGSDLNHFLLQRVSMTGEVTTLADTVLSSEPVVDDGFVYWSASGNGAQQSAVFRVSSALPARPEAVIQRAPSAFGVRAGRVYWVEAGELLSAISD
jgi:hypothetical protein